MKKLCFTLVVAAVLWAVMFSPQTMPLINFWEMMAGSALTLAVLACLFDRSWLKESVWNPQSLLLGIALAAALWGVFWTGDKVAAWLFDFARPQVDMIYGLKESTNSLFLTLLLLLVTGPAEEIFWRGYVQRTISHRWNPNAGFAITTAVYALVHAASCNFMLIMAALVAGIVWGGLYRLFPRRLPVLIVSHAVWDAAVFVWFPI